MSFLSNQPENINSKQGTRRNSLIWSMVEEIVKQDTGIVVAVLFCYFQQQVAEQLMKNLFLMKQCHRGEWCH